MTEYIVLFSNAEQIDMSGTEDLERQVNQKLEEGWVALGGVSICICPTYLNDKNHRGAQSMDTSMYMVQAMIKHTIPGQPT